MTIKAVLHSFAYGLDYLRGRVAGVAAADMAARPPLDRPMRLRVSLSRILCK